MISRQKIKYIFVMLLESDAKTDLVAAIVDHIVFFTGKLSFRSENGSAYEK